MSDHTRAVLSLSGENSRSIEQQIVNSTISFITFRKEEIERSIPERFEHVVRQFPDRIAIKSDHQTLTYRELDRVSNRLAQTLLAYGDEGSEPVTLLLEHGIMVIVAILGILKAGKFYIALNPSYPRSRLTEILKDVQSRFIMSNQKNLSFAVKLSQERTRLINIDEIESCFSCESVDLSLLPDTLAAIFYTSGSTGQPKGIMRNHRNVLHFAWKDASDYCTGPEDRRSLLFSCDFGASTSDIFGTLLNGATLYPYSILENGFHQLANWLNQEEITVFNPPVVLFRQFINSLKETECFPKLRLIFSAGQTLYPKDIEQARKCLAGDCIIVYRLAVSEAGIVSHYFIDQHIKITDNMIPVGYVIKDKEVLLLDEVGQELGFNEAGEIAVRSRYLSPGYWNDPELTHQKFLPDPEGGDKRIYLTGDLGRMREDGCLEYLGRKDFQVKIRGYRVVLTEIEAALYHLNAVKDTAVVAREYEAGDLKLVAYVVPAHQPAPTVSELWQDLAKVLPDYMLPSSFMFLDTLPLTSNGKVDRQALPEPEMTRPTLTTPFVAPQTDMEHYLAALCVEILDIRPIGIEDNLLELGMHSIQALRLLVDIEKRFERKILPQTLLQAVTISQLADIIERQAGSGDSKHESSHTSEHRSSSEIQAFGHSSEPSRKSRLEALFHLDIGGVRLPYSVGIKILAGLCGSRWGQRRYFYPQTIANMRKFLASMDLSADEAFVMQQHLMITHHFRTWQLASLARCTPQQFSHWVEGNGEEIVERVRQQQQSIILIGSHFGLKGIVSRYLDRVGLRQVAHLVGRYPSSQNRKGDPGQDSEQTLLSLDESNSLFSLYTAKQYLQEEQGMVYITPDGGAGFDNISVPFLGRLFPFGAGFAELAIMTGAVIIPVFTSFKSSGHITIEFLEPLETGSSDMSHQDRIASFITQYAALLEQHWREDPGNINPGPLRRFLKSLPAQALPTL